MSRTLAGTVLIFLWSWHTHLMPLAPARATRRPPPLPNRPRLTNLTAAVQFEGKKKSACQPKSTDPEPPIMKLLSAKGLLNVSLHLGTSSSHSSRTNREKVDARSTDVAVVTNHDDNDDDQSVDLAVLLSGEASGDLNTEASHDELQDDQENEVEDQQPALRRETRSLRPVRRAPARHSSCRGLVPPGPADDEEPGPHPPRRVVARHSSCRALPHKEESEARRNSLTRHPSALTLSSRRGSAGASAGSSRLAVVRRTSSRTLARYHASSGSLSAASSHDRSRPSRHGAPARNPSNDTLVSVDSSIQTLPSSDDEGEEEESIAKYGYEPMSGLEYGSAADPRPLRRKPSTRPSQARHPVRKPGTSSHGQSSRTPSSTILDAVEVPVELKVEKSELSRRPTRTSRARRSTPTVLKKHCPPTSLRRTSSDSDQTCGSTSTEGTSPSGSNRSGSLYALDHSSLHQSMTDVLSGLDELDSMLLGSSIHATKSDPWGCS
jgi:hypothetical protein